jgi:hypothetical protein
MLFRDPAVAGPKNACCRLEVDWIGFADGAALGTAPGEPPRRPSMRPHCGRREGRYGDGLRGVRIPPDPHGSGGPLDELGQLPAKQRPELEGVAGCAGTDDDPLDALNEKVLVGGVVVRTDINVDERSVG